MRSSCSTDFVAYLLVRKYGGPGSDKLAAALALFGMRERAVHLHVGEHLAHDSPEDHVVPTLPPGMPGPFWFCVAGVPAPVRAAAAVRVQLERQRAALDELYLAAED